MTPPKARRAGKPWAPGRRHSPEHRAALTASRVVVFTPEMVEAVDAGLAAGVSRARIAERIGVAGGTLWRYLKRRNAACCTLQHSPGNAASRDRNGVL